MVNETSPEQASKAPDIIDLTELGMSTVTRLMQLLNAHDPMDVTELGIVTETRLEQPSKA